MGAGVAGGWGEERKAGFHVGKGSIAGIERKLVQKRSPPLALTPLARTATVLISSLAAVAQGRAGSVHRRDGRCAAAGGTSAPAPLAGAFHSGRVALLHYLALRVPVGADSFATPSKVILDKSQFICYNNSSQTVSLAEVTLEVARLSLTDFSNGGASVSSLTGSRQPRMKIFLPHSPLHR